MSWLDFANYYLSNQRLHAWSWINRTFFGNSVFGGKFGSECFGLFLFYFCLVRGEKVAGARDYGWQSKGEDHFKSWFPFFSYLLVTILYCSNIVWSEDFSVYFFCFLPIFDLEFFFLFCFLPIFDWEFSSLAFFRSLIGNFLFLLFSFDLWLRTSFSFSFLFSSEGEDAHSHPRSRFMVSWDFGSRLVEWLDMLYVSVLVCPTLFPWHTCNNDD